MNVLKQLKIFPKSLKVLTTALLKINQTRTNFIWLKIGFLFKH